MIRQLKTTTKADTTTLAYSDMGDVIANPNGPVEYILPSPLAGLWYRVTNITAHVVTILYGGTITTIGQNENVLLLANGTTGWYYTKGAGSMTKAQIEDVLIGTLGSHNHVLSGSAPPTSTTVAGFIGQLYLDTSAPLLYFCTSISEGVYAWEEVHGNSGDTSFISLTDSPASYEGANYKLIAVNATANGLEFVPAASGCSLNGAFAKNKVILTEESATFALGLTYDSGTDVIFIYQGGIYQTIPDDLSISGTTATKASGTWPSGTEFDIIVISRDDAVSFIGLGDVPASYTGYGGKIVAIKTAEDGLEFIDAPDSSVVESIWGGI